MLDIVEKIKSVIAEQAEVKPEEVTEKAKFIDDLGLDSLDMVELVMELEEECGVEIPDEDAEKLTTVGEAISYVEKRLSTK
ncbi:MAG: acyl carrier protein [Candidatus Omnitrophica bacterium]|nr:acyl carrier protein [Candidatus Omnitrophota bacterium]